MAERAMADVMEQGRGVKNPSVLRQVRITAVQVPEGTPGEMEHPQGMGEAAGFRAVEGQKSWTELADASQALKRPGIDESHHHRLDGIVPVQGNPPMQRIVIGALAHVSPELCSASS